jgi:hypothetical protein
MAEEIRPDDVLLKIAEVAERLKMHKDEVAQQLNLPLHKVYTLTVRQLNPLITVELGGRRLRVTERHLRIFQHPRRTTHLLRSCGPRCLHGGT